MKYIDQSGQGNTLLILTDKESRQLRTELDELQTGSWRERAKVCSDIINRGIARGTAKMTAESKAEWKARKK